MKTIFKPFTALVAMTLTLVGCAGFGTQPDKKRVQQFQSSPQYNIEKGIFENRRAELIEKMRKETMNWGLVKEWFKKGIDRVPEQKLPEEKPDLAEFVKPGDDVKVIWFGHSTFLLNMQGKIVLVDPVFSESAAPVSFMVKRFQAPVLSLEELPAIDYVLISHDHYDHLDMESVKFFKDKNARFITPLGVGSHLTGWGINPDRIVEKDWWQSFTDGTIEFVATPAQHFSGRDMIHDNETLWASWVVIAGDKRVYFSGDSGYDTHFKAIGEKYGPFDIAFIESGQYNKRWEAVHMLPEQGVQAYRDLGAKKYFPVHWGMFELSLHTWYDPIEKLYQQAQAGTVNLMAPRLGQVVSSDANYPVDNWWDLVPQQKDSEVQLTLAPAPGN